MTASFLIKKKRINMDIIQGYIPTNDSQEDEKDSLNSRLSTIIQDRPKRNIIILIGDFNVKICSITEDMRRSRGRNG
ncbi:hypothetical protein DPMN_014203 [Dreissena polymorpha]|uniref:Endonuclease/exonuclease/phosphatase domain-containing protein n=1 Tax=Dreissena polymorpha TaxID=45954 RepID=A0A9D4S502_DREPO|nr:hypothetical protein DPMN_014203 [Dreissena polymorpha]